MGRVEHDNPADYYNTCFKQGKKRSHTDAILTATMASALLTQDIDEDPSLYGGQSGNEPPKQPQKSTNDTGGDTQDAQAQRIKEIDQWLLEMAGGVEADYKALLKRVTVYEKDGVDHFIRKIDELQSKVRWTNKAHNITKELYTAWKKNQDQKQKPAGEQNPDDDELFESDFK